MVARADPSLMTIIGLQAGVAQDIERYGSEELRQRYLPRFVSGELQGCMDLTEPQAGSDLGGIVTRATEEHGRFFLDGEKIFITNGGSDVHLVLARDGASFDQSRGTTNGLNLMLCPVTLPDGRRNGVRVARVERKMGIHGSPTCVIELEHAEAFLLGTRGQGFRAMLDLMNNARLGVGAQAIGVAEAAYRAAREYAAQRVQFGTPIVQQPLVKSMLTLMAINLQAARALLYRTCALIDMTEAIRRYLHSERSARDPGRIALQEELEHNTQLIRFFTPLCKYYATEISNHVTRQGIQVHGGIGYMAESPAGHYHSDSIITTIYEGTSEIQAGARADADRPPVAERRAGRPGPARLRRHQQADRHGGCPDGRPAVCAPERQAGVRDGDRRRGERGAPVPGRGGQRQARAGGQLHPPAHARRRGERPPHRERRRDAHQAVRPDPRALSA